MFSREQVILTKRLQQDYEKVAHMVIAYIEVCYFNDKHERANDMLMYIRNEYVRVIAFRNMVRDFFNNSELLPQINLGKVVDEN